MVSHVEPCSGKHNRQRIITHADGRRVQVCERCGHIIATLRSPRSLSRSTNHPQPEHKMRHEEQKLQAATA